MELQGKKVTHDFLSLYSSDSSFQLQDARPSSQGFFRKTRDFLQPLDPPEKAEAAAAVAAVPATGPAERVLPGGGGRVMMAAAAAASTRAGFPIALETKPEPDYGSRITTASYGSYAVGASSYALWDDQDAASRGQWPSHFGSAGPVSAAAAGVGTSSGRHEPAPEKKRFMEGAASGSSRGYDGVDDDEEFGKREGSSSRKDLTIKVDGKASCTPQDQRPNTPRSKHSATEQRRRSKINDRFQILREIIPHSDQKRDKASFLLEVIEYIRFLQEKVHRHESSYPGWIQDNAKLMPWQNSSQASASGLLVTPAHAVKDDSTPALVFPPKNDEMGIPVVPPTMFNTHNLPKKMEITTPFTSNPTSTSNLIQPNFFYVGKQTSISQSQQKRLSEEENMASQDQSPLLRTCSLAGFAASRQMLNDAEELTIDEGTISLSTAYSDGLLTTLTQALQSSGIDLSEANISVKINLGKRAVSQRPTAATTTATAKGLEEDPASFNQGIGYSSRVKSSDEGSSRASKRLKAHG